VRDLGAKDNRKKQMRPAGSLMPIPAKGSKGELSNTYRNDDGYVEYGCQIREFEPTDEYRHLLSPETRAALEGK